MYSSLRQQPTFRDTTDGLPSKWCLKNGRRNFILMTHHSPDLGSAFDWSIRSTNQIWVLTRHQYGISALVSQTSFRGETIGGVAKCRLFSHARRYCSYMSLALCASTVVNLPSSKLFIWAREASRVRKGGHTAKPSSIPTTRCRFSSRVPLACVLFTKSPKWRACWQTILNINVSFLLPCRWSIKESVAVSPSCSPEKCKRNSADYSKQSS